ncbi:MAG: hypothetical protein JO132_15630 [Streptosporangiaceae bacterium]|nr:hypothetical protein [Streptosporangiaceae bacterium]
MAEARRLVSGGPVADLTARIGIIGQRQEELAEVVGKLHESVGDFGQLHAYVEQLAEILAGVAKEVAAHDLTMLELRLDKLVEAVGEMDKLRIEVGKLRDEVHDVAELAGELAKRPEAQRAAWWPDLPAGQERAEALQSLGRWVDEVLRGRHPEAYNELGSCWFWHPDILDELTALHAAWLAAYRDKASSGTAAIEWHDRWLPGAMARCRAAIAARGCKGRHEKVSGSTVEFLDRQEFKNFARSGPEPIAPVAEPSPPWAPITDPSPPVDAL